MNRRAVDERLFIPPIEHDEGDSEQTHEESAEAVAFDKAEEAEAAEDLNVRYEEMGVQLEALRQQSKQAADSTEKETMKMRVAEIELARERLKKAIQEDT